MFSMIVELIILLVVHAAAGIYSSTLKFSRKTTCFIWTAWIILQSILLIYTELFLTDTTAKFFAGFIPPIISQYVIFLATTKGRLSQRIFTLQTYSIFFCIFIALFMMIKGTFGNLHPLLVIGIQAATLLSIVSYYLLYICPLCLAAGRNMTSGWVPLILVNTVFLITVILSSVFPTRLASFSDPSSLSFLFLSASIMAVYPVIFFSINTMSEAATMREVERQNKLLLAQIEIENMQLAADSHARHDRRHHNLVLLEFANKNDIDSVREYLRNLVDQDKPVWPEKKHCDHVTVNTVLTAYERRAKEQDICVNISATVSSSLHIAPQDLVIVIANLFENAIHATAKLRGKNKVIDIYIKESTKRLLITVENPCRSSLSFDESLYGVGIRSVIATTNKYGGMYDFSAEDGLFSGKVSLNIE